MRPIALFITTAALQPASMLAIAGLLIAQPLDAQVAGAVQRAATRKAGEVAAKQAVQRAEIAAVRRAMKDGRDVAVRQWRTGLCSNRAPCPLPAEAGNRFRGGAYHEVVLGRDTLFHGRMTAQEARAGRPLTQHTTVSRVRPPSPQQGGPHRNPYGAEQPRGYTLWVPKGTRVFEGKARGWPGGPRAGSQQTMVSGISPAWVAPY